LRQLWRSLDVQTTLQEWSLRVPQGDALHATVWEQLNAWLDDLALAFSGESMSLRDWLPILETGLTRLTVGVIPPVLDQVLIGAIDRSRNPDLRLVLLLGVNETVFPAAPAGGSLLSETNREELGQWEIFLGPTRREFLGRERFLGYIACTRSRERVILTCSERNAGGEPLNPSPFFSHLRTLFPGLEIEAFAQPDWTQAEHACELTAPLIGANRSSPLWHELLQRPAFASVREQIPLLTFGVEREHLTPELAGQLYGPALRTSVSRLEDYAACAFKFFIHSGLRAEERQHFELDVRERGSFQHAVLASFHERLRLEEKQWRDLSPDDARRRVREAVDDLVPRFRDGLLAVNAQSQFAARAVTASLQEYVAATVTWMDYYQFDPYEVELGFGDSERAKLPAWELDLGAGRRLILRGFIDRVDLCRRGSAEDALAVVIDYKSSLRKLDKVLIAHGLQLQLVAYLGVLRHLANPQPAFGVARLIPAGVFYVNLRGQAERGETRTAVLAGAQHQRRRYQHTGRFDAAILPWLDQTHDKISLQFNVKLKANGQPDARGADMMSSTDFRQLLDQVEAALIRMGREIYDGVLRPNPFQKGSDRACDRCDYAGICRFDPWSDPYRLLGKPPA
jgi:ATP-dependent helicase/nuclease subunit B